jgi:signal peptidase II
MTSRKRLALILLTLAAGIGCDQQTKFLAMANLRGREPYSFFADTVRFDYTENPGSFLGLGDSIPTPWRTVVFTYGCTAGVAAMLAYVCFAARLNAVQVLALSLMCVGGIGNLLDRWIYGSYVRDFLNLGLGSLRTGIFNVADAALMTGCVLALLTSWTDRARRES